MNEKRQKDFVTKKEIEPATGGGGGDFLSGAISRFLGGDNLPAPAPEGDWEITKRAAKRVMRNHAIDERLERLEGHEAARKRTANTSRRCPLWLYVAEVKRKFPAKRSDHAFITLRVDVILGRNKERLITVCPKSWRVSGLPRLFSEARLYLPLKGRIKTFISKVRVS